MTGAAWLVAAATLGLAELLLPGLFLVFFAVAAAITGMLALTLPALGIAGEVASFLAWSAASVLIGRRWYRDYPVASADPLLNDRAARLVGQLVRVDEAIRGGEGRVRVGDGTWPAVGPDAAPGTPVRVVAVNSGVLRVEVPAGPS